jgi:hypothetical protein
LQGDGVAEGFELVDEVADLAVGVDVGGVEVWAQVVESGGGVGQEVPDDDEDGSGDGDEGFEFAAAFDQSSVAFPEEGVGLGGAGGGVAECAFEVGVALAGLARSGRCTATTWVASPLRAAWSSITGLVAPGPAPRAVGNRVADTDGVALP